LLERDEVISAAVFTRDGELFHSGSPKLQNFGDKAPPEILELLANPKQQVEPLVDMTIRIVTPVVADGYVFGALDMLIDTHFVEQQIEVLKRELIAAAEIETRQQILQLLAVSVISLIIAAAVATVLAARLSAPIQELAEATNLVSRGDFDVPINSKRSDEFGALATAFDQMSFALKETMISRSDLQHRVEEQTTELRAAHETLVAVEIDRRDVLDEIGDDLRLPIAELESDAEHALRNQDSALELRHSMSRLLLRIRDVGRLVDDLRLANRSNEPRKAGRRSDKS
jgi:nitrogen fixation/metabolism regulation signal transduction histidine kinase